MRRLIDGLRHGADAVAAGLLAAIFVLFLLQIVTRYVIRQPLGWTLEACLLAWLWLVFWSAAFTLNNRDHVRFNILSESVRPGTRKWFAAIAAVIMLATFSLSFMPTLDFVDFMAIESTSLLKFRFDHVFAIYLVFAAAIILRSAWTLLRLMRGYDP